jgi:hypothetical protein
MLRAAATRVLAHTKIMCAKTKESVTLRNMSCTGWPSARIVSTEEAKNIAAYMATLKQKAVTDRRALSSCHLSIARIASLVSLSFKFHVRRSDVTYWKVSTTMAIDDSTCLGKVGCKVYPHRIIAGKAMIAAKLTRSASRVADVTRQTLCPKLSAMKIIDSVTSTSLAIPIAKSTIANARYTNEENSKKMYASATTMEPITVVSQWYGADNKRSA